MMPALLRRAVRADGLWPLSHNLAIRGCGYSTTTSDSSLWPIGPLVLQIIAKSWLRGAAATGTQLADDLLRWEMLAPFSIERS